MLHAGAALRDITPPLGTGLGGLFVPRPAKAVRAPLLAQAVYLQDGAERAGIVSCDLVAMPGDLAQDAAQEIYARTGLPPERVIFTATHTHAGPDIMLRRQGAPQAYRERMAALMAEALIEAFEQRRPARAAVGVGECRGIALNRRLKMKDGTVHMNWEGVRPEDVVGTGPIDEQVGVVRLDTADGRPLAALVNFTLHACVDARDEIHPDYPGAMRAALQQKVGERLPVLFLQGAAGDVNHIDYRHEWEGDPYDQVLHIGGKLADSVWEIWQALGPTDAPVRLAAEMMEFRRRELPSLDEAREKVKHWEEIVAKDSAEKQSDHYMPLSDAEYELFFAKQIVKIIETEPEVERTYVQALRLGDACFVTAPGEIFCQYGLDLKARRPLPHPFVVELSNDYFGYYPTLEAFGEGGYEPRPKLRCNREESTGDQLLAKWVELIGRL